MFVHSSYYDYVILGSFESTEDEPYLESTEDRGSYAGTQSSSSNQTKSREIIAWVLVVILSVLLIVSLAIHMIQVTWAYRRSNGKDTSPDCTVAMDSNPCYEASNVKLNKAQEAVPV